MEELQIILELKDAFNYMENELSSFSFNSSKLLTVLHYVKDTCDEVYETNLTFSYLSLRTNFLLHLLENNDTKSNKDGDCITPYNLVIWTAISGYLHELDLLINHYSKV